jgi:cell division septum initiation protein DivIVA
LAFLKINNFLFNSIFSYKIFMEENQRLLKEIENLHKELRDVKIKIVQLEYQLNQMVGRPTIFSHPNGN